VYDTVGAALARSLRDRVPERELPGFRYNGHFSAREYVPRAFYKGGAWPRMSRPEYAALGHPECRNI
jgi:hypothetical protein